jgi:hypothetical protein
MPNNDGMGHGKARYNLYRMSQEWVLFWLCPQHLNMAATNEINIY